MEFEHFELTDKRYLEDVIYASIDPYAFFHSACGLVYGGLTDNKKLSKTLIDNDFLLDGHASYAFAPMHCVAPTVKMIASIQAEAFLTFLYSIWTGRPASEFLHNEAKNPRFMAEVFKAISERKIPTRKKCFYEISDAYEFDDFILRSIFLQKIDLPPHAKTKLVDAVVSAAALICDKSHFNAVKHGARVGSSFPLPPTFDEIEGVPDIKKFSYPSIYMHHEKTSKEDRYCFTMEETDISGLLSFIFTCCHLKHLMFQLRRAALRNEDFRVSFTLPLELIVQRPGGNAVRWSMSYS